ncbi:HlyD family efflux transporter periplasmic adaptor subunit [Gluconacetobacter diazotrophicus]|uniref:HlyD family efflux transporter periplasmic adaptor subunit n=1 Tax=Gluconacetobacter diazotrophicus TaxID=33996 RepID=A0A7W4NIJ1_GLUDI|nr:HlyD family efflux transporter periplasmic adaptor subunit [Gluconacetobacter diazotrophicus]
MLVISTIFALFMLLRYGVYTRRVHATGQIVPIGGVVSILPGQPGTITSVHAREGQRVKNGDVLFELDLDVVNYAGNTRARVIETLFRQKHALEDQRKLRSKNAKMEKDALSSELELTREQRRASLSQIKEYESVTPVVDAQLNRMRNATVDHVISTIQLQQQSLTYAQIMFSKNQAVNLRSESDIKLTELSRRLASFDDDVAKDLDEIDRQIARIDEDIEDNEGHRHVKVEAPCSGVLTSLTVTLGQQVEAATPLATIVQGNDAVQAELYVSSDAIGFIRPGQPVLLRYDPYPYRRFGLYLGRVTEITRAPLPKEGSQWDTQAGHANPADSGGLSGNVFRVIVTPDHRYVLANGERHRLEAGTALSADIAIEKRQLWAWAIDPLVGVGDAVETAMLGAGSGERQ